MRTTGKERDQESQLDYFPARHYAYNLGRWMSPDWSAQIAPVPYAAINDPQSLNLYAYLRNNALASVDLDGHDDSLPSRSACMNEMATTDTSGDHLMDGPACTSIMQASPFKRTSPNPFLRIDSNLAIAQLSRLSFDQPLLDPTDDPILLASNNGNKNPFLCGSEAAGKISAAAALHNIPGLGSGVGGFIADAVGGNAFSGATDLIHSIGTGEGCGHSVFYNMGQGVIAGPTQGFGSAFGSAIEGTPWAADIVSVGLKAIPLVGEYASGIGEAKLIYDGVTYFGATAGCALGIVH